jgi:hypothetical protein
MSMHSSLHAQPFANALCDRCMLMPLQRHISSNSAGFLVFGINQQMSSNALYTSRRATPLPIPILHSDMTCCLPQPTSILHHTDTKLSCTGAYAALHMVPMAAAQQGEGWHLAVRSQ